MGKRGPPPEPSILKYIRGNPSKGKLNDKEPTPDLVDEDVMAPSHVAEVPLALQKWQYAAPILQRMKLLTEADVESLARYCLLWAKWKLAYDKSLQLGDEITHFEPDPNRTDGKLRIKWTQVAPWTTQYKSLGRDLLRLEQEFGLTPASRSQVTIHANTNDDPLAAFVQKRGG